jgi:RHS repeat-associated protein
VNTFYSPTPVGDQNYIVPDVKLRSLVKSTQVEGPTGAVAMRTEYEYDDPLEKGNATAVRRWSSAKGPLAAVDQRGFRLNDSNSVLHRIEYDGSGNAIRRLDGMGVATEMEYGGVGGFRGIYPTRKTEAAGTSVSKTEVFEYDLDSGLIVISKALGNTADEDIVNTFGYDAAGRKVLEVSAAGTPAERRTVTEYHEGRRLKVTKSDRIHAGDGLDVVVEHFDQLGRLRLSRRLDKPWSDDPLDEADGIKVQHRRKTLHGAEAELTSNPYRAATSAEASEGTMGWELVRLTAAGRKKDVSRFTGAEPPAPWGGNPESSGTLRTELDGDRTLSIDESGVRTIVRHDALGRVADVWEVIDSGDASVTFAGASFRAFRTMYQHTVSDDLTRVVQGVQTRSFSYDSLSRLVSSSHPESGTETFTHDDNGNIRSKTDARGVKTFLFHDALNRIVNRSHDAAAGTDGYVARSAVTYSYDDYRVPFSKGRLTRVHTSHSDHRVAAFDAVGRTRATEQMTDGLAFRTEYDYTLGGEPVRVRYPSGRIVEGRPGPDGGLATVLVKRKDQEGSRAYASGFRYAPSGAVEAMRLGNRIWESAGFNSRMQLASLSVGTSKGASNLLGISNRYADRNNGNIVSQTVSMVDGTVASQTFGYDGFNRLVSATETLGATHAWAQSFSYDRFGNRTLVEASTSTLPKNCRSSKVLTVCPSDRKRLNPAVSQTNNRFTADQDGDKVDDYRYDPAGNLLRDADGRVIGYDGESRQSVVRDAFGNLIGEYFYDGFGRRVKRVTYVNNRPDETVVYVHGADGEVVAEYSTRPERHLAGKTLFVTADHLGTPRMMTDQSGRVVSRHDYLPFGEEIARRGYGADAVARKFTGYERDLETGLDHAGARYYSPPHGRFSSVDPARESMVARNPQSWNRYTYVLNNPLRFTDPSGELWVLNTGGDRLKNPYRWVDSCASGQTCWEAVALGTSGAVRVYGSRGASDITNYHANAFGQVNVDAMLGHRDSNVMSVAMQQGIPEPYLSITAATTLFNVAMTYKNAFPGDGKLVFTAGNGPGGMPCTRSDGRACHSGHRGNDIDLRYMDPSGNAVMGRGASSAADAARTRLLVRLFAGSGFPESYSGDSARLGTLPSSAGTERAHRNHLHIGVFDVSSKPVNGTRRRRVGR